MHFLDKNAIMLFHVTVPAQLGDKRIGDEVFVGTSIHFGPEGDLHSILFAGNERHDCRVTGNSKQSRGDENSRHARSGYVGQESRKEFD